MICSTQHEFFKKIETALALVNYLVLIDIPYTSTQIQITQLLARQHEDKVNL